MTSDLTIARLTKRLDDIQARLDNTLDMLVHAERNNHRLSVELAHAHREIAELTSQRDTWRARSAQ